ncbi:FAD-binding oxidoreductase [Granulicoccus phenolivorans]|nr:FAD-binding oxidoreductase [Granulicoccus phenolivorans]
MSALRERVQGSVISPESAEYEAARAVWNAAHDRRPALIVQCESAADVAAAIGSAVAGGLEIAVRGGAHSMSGASTGDDTLVIDLRKMNSVHVDPENRRARVGGGALLGDVDRAAQEHGLATPFGLVSHTGVGGLTLGGGMGWLTRLHGLSIDNLLSAEVVLANGQIVRASAEENPELFWGLRGGGGNFGVVTEFEFRLHPVGPMVHFALLFWSLDQGVAAMRAIREVMVDLPHSVNAVPALGITMPPAPFVPPEHQGKQGYALLVAGFGDAAEHEGVLERMRAALPPTFEFVTPMPYTGLQSLVDAGNAAGFWDYEKGASFAELSDEAIAVLAEHLPRRTSPLSVMLLYRLDQAYSEVPEDATAFGGGRSPRFGAFMLGICPDPALLSGERDWLRAMYQALTPFMIDEGAYVNSLAQTGEESRVRAAYGDKYDRLVEIKNTYDPQNIFHRNANIPARNQ